MDLNIQLVKIVVRMKLVNVPEGFNNAEENTATLAEKTSNDVSVSGNAGYPEGFDQVMEEVKDPMSTSVVALKERCHSESDMEVNNMDDSLTLTKESSNNVQVSGYPKDINQRNQVTKKIKDPMNAVSLKERRRMVKELVLLDENPKPVYDYLVPTCNRFENEYVATPIKADATFKGLDILTINDLGILRELYSSLETLFCLCIRTIRNL